MNRALLFAPLLLAAACSPLPMPDACSEPPLPFDVTCKVVRADGVTAAPGIGVRCGSGSGSAVTDGNGQFSISATQMQCGIAAGSIDCGQVTFIGSDGGALTVRGPGSDAGETQVWSGKLTGSTCRTRLE